MNKRETPKTIHVQETDPQTTLDGNRRPKKNGTVLIMRGGKGVHFNKIMAQLYQLDGEGAVIVKEVTKKGDKNGDE